MVKAHGLAVAALLAWALCIAQPALGQDPVDGVCHDSVRNGCSAGTPNDAALADTSNAYKWRCDGLHGGRDSRICFIRVEDVVDGVCDESRRNGCSAGTPNAAAYPDEPVVYQWRCDGLGGGRNSGRCALWFSVVGVCDESVRNGCSAGNPTTTPSRTVRQSTRGAATACTAARTRRSASSSFRWTACATTAFATAAPRARPTTPRSRTARTRTCGAATACTAARTRRSASSPWRWTARATRAFATAARPARPTTPRSRTLQARTCGAAMACTAARTRRGAASSFRWTARATRACATAARPAPPTTPRLPTRRATTSGVATAATAGRTPACAPRRNRSPL